ncbi:MAG: OmpA family protein [Burkholderiaceae bacterium]|nr:OmpA family protein [Burkholderiaceae bacterium]
MPAQPSHDAALPFALALNQSVDDLFSQTQKLPAFLARVESRLKLGAIVVDPLLDGASGQQTEVTKMAEQRVIERVQDRFQQFTVLSFNSGGVAGAQYLLNGTLTQIGASTSQGQYRLSLALVELKSGLVIAQAVSRVSDVTLNTNPTAFYRDSPVIAKDRVVEGYIRTSETKAGLPADALYLDRLPTSALVSEAIISYNAERFNEALTRYEAAANRADGQQLRIYSGLYLTQRQLGKTEAAEKTFGTIARLGLATNNLSVKFLFKPGSTEFVSDAKVSGAYPMWLRQIARQAVLIDACVVVTGHTSRTGSEQINTKLSLQRASLVKQRLEIAVPELAKKLRDVGLGYLENIVGTATDDARDALDRRVEFKVTRCDA